ncbi:MAG: hypothetical protein EPN45_02415 [Rhizobiaceae bacterium]|nr:MAG: hypothetical protein EPN45_02415 [Rhizobiaceae bacterium]
MKKLLVGSLSALALLGLAACNNNGGSGADNTTTQSTTPPSTTAPSTTAPAAPATPSTPAPSTGGGTAKPSTGG